MAFETILLDIHGKVGLITLNRPQALNALNAQIATAAEQQSQVAQEIDQRVTHISSLAERSQGETESVVQVSAQIQGEVRQLNSQLGCFRT